MILEVDSRNSDNDRGDDDDVVDRRAFGHDGNPVGYLAKTAVEKLVSTLPTTDHPDLVSN